MKGHRNMDRKHALLWTTIVSFILYWTFDAVELSRGELAHQSTIGNVIMLVLLLLIVVPFLGLLWVRRNERRKSKPGG